MAAYDMSTAKMRYTKHVGSPVQSVSFSHNGRFLAFACVDKRARVPEALSHQIQHTFTGHTDGLKCVAFSPDDRTLASSSDDGSVCVWDLSTGSCLKVYRHQAVREGTDFRGWCVAYSPDGRTLASCGRDAKIKLWDLSTRQDRVAVQSFWMRIGGLVFSADDRRVRVFGRDSTDNHEPPVASSIDADAGDGKCREAGGVDLRGQIYAEHRSRAGLRARESAPSGRRVLPQTERQ